MASIITHLTRQGADKSNPNASVGRILCSSEHSKLCSEALALHLVPHYSLPLAGGKDPPKSVF